MHSLLIWGEYEMRLEKERWRSRVFFSLGLLYFATSLLFESLAQATRKATRQRNCKVSLQKKLSLSIVLFMLLKFISFSMSFRLTFFVSQDVSFQAVSGTVNLIFISNKDDTP